MNRRGALALSAGVALGVGWLVAAEGPAPAADVRRGTEGPFTKGLHQRELPPRQGPQRWTGDRVEVVFADLAAGPSTVEVALRGHRGPVAVSCDGVLVGHLAAGTSSARFPLPETRGAWRTIELRMPTFRAGDGRDLGSLFDRVAITSEAPRARPSLRIALIFVLPAVVAAAGAAFAGLGGLGMLGSAALVAVVQAAALWPGGLVRSSYAPRLAVALVCVMLAAAVFARAARTRWAGAGPWAWGALVAAVLVQGVAALSPVMVVSDA